MPQAPICAWHSIWHTEVGKDVAGHAVERQTTTDVDVKFLISFKSPADIIFRKELELISARHARVAVTLTSAWAGQTGSWTGLTARFDRSTIHVLVPDLDQRHVFLCGPEPFAAEVRRILQKLGFDQAKLHSESFGSWS